MSVQYFVKGAIYEKYQRNWHLAGVFIALVAIKSIVPHEDSSPSQYLQRLFHALHVGAGEFGDRFVTHEAAVGDGADLVYEQVSFCRLFGEFAQRDAQRVAVTQCIAIRLSGAGDNDGGGVACIVEDVGLDDQGGAAALAWFFFVGLGFEINFPELAAF